MAVKEAVLVVDMQNDFLSGSLIVPGALEMVGEMQDYLLRQQERGVKIYYSFCWHPKDHCSFIPQGGKWPVHCVQGTWGAEVQVGLKVMADRYQWAKVMKGTDISVDEYSACTPRFVKSLEDHRIKSLSIIGVARNVCVEETFKEAKRHVEFVEVVERLSRGV